jgi:hypothetical protein
MSQEEVLSIISAFGPISTRDLVRHMRFGHNSVADSIRVLSKRTHEIEQLPRLSGALRAFWVAR